MTRIPITPASIFQIFQVELESRPVTMTIRYGFLVDAWTFSIEEDGVPLVRGQRLVLGTELLRGHALRLGGLVLVAAFDPGIDPAEGDFDERVSLFHLTEEELSAAVA